MIDPKTGKKKVGKLTGLRVVEVSLVDKPANPGARIVLHKTADKPAPDVHPEGVLKTGLMEMFKGDDGAQSFTDALAENEARERAWKAQEELWKLFDALRESLTSIACDTSLVPAEKLKQIETSVDQFVTAIRAKFPDVEGELIKLLSEHPDFGEMFKQEQKDTPDMDPKELQKKLDEQAAQIKALTDTVTTLQAEKASKLSDAETEYQKSLPATEQDAFAKMAPADRAKLMTEKPIEKKAAQQGDDEMLKFGNEVIKKSEVGAGVFAALKMQQQTIAAQAGQIVAIREDAEILKLTTEAEQKFPNLPGSPTEKAQALRAIRQLDKGVARTIEQMLAAGDKGAGSNLNEVGKGGSSGNGGGSNSPLVKGQAETAMDNAARELMKTDTNLSFEQAFTKVMDSNPNLYSQYLAETTRR